MKNKKNIVFLIMTILFCLLIGNTEVKNNNRKLKKEIFSIDKESVYINEVIPFEWDAIYSFSPYTSKEEIVANPGGFPHKLGYRISIPYDYEKQCCVLSYEDGAIFNVEKRDGIVYLEILQISK